jgi:hypothetical protein
MATPAKTTNTAEATKVTADNFERAETDHYLGNFVREGALGKFVHNRDLVDLDHQKVIRMNRDTLYSEAVIDLDAGPATVTLPDAGSRYMGALVIDEDHYVVDTFYDSAPRRYERKPGGTRYIVVIMRTVVDPSDPSDLDKVHMLQDAMRIDQPGGPGSFEIPNWDETTQKQVRAELSTHHREADMMRVFGARGEVDPFSHRVVTATGWGGNPPRDALYFNFEPEKNDGETVYQLTLRDVPVDGFWSVTFYDKDGYFRKNPQDAYSFNNVTAKPDADGSVTIQFGGCDGKTANCLPITPGWSYSVRLYRPRKEILDGTWEFPEAKVVS